MGTIIALGGGRFDNGEMLSVAQFIRDASGKAHPHVLFLPTAGFDDMNGDEPIREAFLSLGCTFEALLLTDAALTAEQVHETILGCDIVYAGGGNLQFLMDTWNRTGASDALREAFDRGVVLSGLSSGAMCWFEGGYDDCGPDHAFVFIPCLGLLPHYYCPHFISESWQSFAMRVPETGKSGIGVEDGAALVYRDGQYSVITGNEGGDAFFFDKTQGYQKICITDNASLLGAEYRADLSRFDGACVRITCTDGGVFEGMCLYNHAEYCAIELGVHEDALEIDGWVFYRSGIRAVEPIGEKGALLWMGRPVRRIRLEPDAFRPVELGQKTIEVRPADEACRAVQVGDVIRFENTADETDVVYAEVQAKHTSSTFEQVFAALPQDKIGRTIEEVHRKYTAQEEQDRGAAAIRFALL